MTYIHENKVNKISDCNLLYDIINPSKYNKLFNIQYSLFLHGCMNPLKCIEKFNSFCIVLDSGCGSMIPNTRLITTLNPKRDTVMQMTHTRGK